MAEQMTVEEARLQAEDVTQWHGFDRECGEEEEREFYRRVLREIANGHDDARALAAAALEAER